MTANELADALDDVVANYIQMIADVDFSDVATMLRHQQALIEQLEKTQDYLYKTHDADKAEIEALKALVISMSDRNANIQYTKASEK